MLRLPDALRGVLFESVDSGVWERVFAHLAEISCAFGSAGTSAPYHRRRSGNVRRQDRPLPCEMTCSPELSRPLRDGGEVIVDGKPVPNLTLLWPRIESRGRAVENDARGSIVHGGSFLFEHPLRPALEDLQADRSSGSFGEVGLFGDLATHPRSCGTPSTASTTSSSTICSRWRSTVTPEAPVRATAGASRNRRAIREGLLRRAYDRRDISSRRRRCCSRACGAALDKPQRQLAMYTRSLQLFDEAFQD